MEKHVCKILLQIILIITQQMIKTTGIAYEVLNCQEQSFIILSPEFSRAFQQNVEKVRFLNINKQVVVYIPCDIRRATDSKKGDVRAA